MSTTTIPILLNEPHKLVYKAGETIFTRGHVGDAMYGVVNGQVDIKLGDKVVETIGEGGVFGELALVDTEPRSADAIAKTDCTLAIIDSNRFMVLVSQNPWFSISVMRVMSERIRRWGV
jgi:CRP-like cAMP-binding protein